MLLSYGFEFKYLVFRSLRLRLPLTACNALLLSKTSSVGLSCASKQTSSLHLSWHQAFAIKERRKIAISEELKSCLPALPPFGGVNSTMLSGRQEDAATKP
jgi:hypothetical protein